MSSREARSFQNAPQPAGAAEIWRRALVQLRSTLPNNTYDTWFARTRAVEMRSGKLIVSVDNVYKREALLSNYYSTIAIAVEEAAGRRIEVNVIVDPGPHTGEAPEATLGVGGENAPLLPSAARTRPVLKRSYTLDSFVVGPSNQIAYAAASAVAERPGRSHNPLFIHADSGLGKTHLLQGVAHITLRSAQTYCISTEAYVREYVEAVRTGNRTDFQNKYEQADVLIVDDVQELAGKERTQDEFFNVFNALHMADKQIVLSSDTPPRRLRGLPERLVTRFEWGLVVEISKPDLELRLAILRQKCIERGLQIGDDVLRLLAQRASHNVRELEGVLSHVQLFADIEGAPVTSALALRSLEGYRFEDAERAPPTIGEIISATCEAAGVPPEVFTTKRKDQRAARARHLAMYLAREHTGLSYKEIGAHFGDRDHTTILHGYRKILGELEGDPSRGKPPKAETQRVVSDIRSRLRL